MLFRVLGDIVIVDDDGEARTIVAPRQRALFAMLVLRANRVLGPHAAVEGLWGDDMPDHPAAALQVVMSRLRRAMGPGAERIRSEGGGYRLEAGPEEVDVTRVEALLRSGRNALAENDAAGAARMLDTALEQWSGDALTDLVDFPFHAAAHHRLAELRWTVYEARCTAYLREGRHLEVLADIGAWVVAEPLGEHVRALQVVALYRSGRQADALGACRDLRLGLREQLGVEPSPNFQELERKVLDHDTDLLAGNVGVTLPVPAWTSLALPFVGREVECDQASASLRGAIRGGLRFLLVEGQPGSGRSRLLVELARRFGRDVIVVPLDVHESLASSVVMLARSLAALSRRMEHGELDAITRAVPEFASVLSPAASPDNALLDEVAYWIGALSTKAPVVILVDDLDRASPKLLHVIGLLLAVDVKRVLVVASAEPASSSTAQPLGKLVFELDHARPGTVDRIALGPLGEPEIEQLLGRITIAPGGPRRRIGRQLMEITGGSPFLLAELLNTGQAEHLAEQWSVPPKVRDVVLARLDALGRATAAAIKTAAVFEHEFSVALLRDMLGLPEAATMTIVTRALDAHVFEPSGVDRYRFAHQLARQTIADELTPDERADAHRRAAVAMERAGGASATVLARHWSEATGPDADEKTIEYTWRAGDEAKRALEPTIAAQWYELARERLGDDPRRGQLLCDLAEADILAGTADFVQPLREAIQVALEQDDDALVTRIVTLGAPGWWTLPGLPPVEMQPLFDRALAVAGDAATRSRVLSRVSSERALTDPSGAEASAREAIELARASGDATARLATLVEHTAMLHGPDSLLRRRAEIEEALPLAYEMRNEPARYFLASSGVIAAVQAADWADATRYREMADAVTARSALAPLHWSRRFRRAWMMGLAGRLDEAERLIRRARNYGRATDLAHAEGAALLQFAYLRWQQDRVDTVGAYLDGVSGAMTEFPGLAHVVVRALASDPAQHAAARARMDDLAADRFDDLRRGRFALPVLIVIAESAWLLGMPHIAGILRARFAPYLDQVACDGSWVAGPVAYGAALAAATMNERDADELFELAIVVAERINAPVLRARAQLAWATSAVRDSKRGPAHTIDLCRDVIATARALDLAELEHKAASLQDAVR